MEYTQIIRDFIEKYDNNEYYTKDIETKFLNWLDNTDNDEIKRILSKLFSEFRFFSKIEIKEILRNQLMGVIDSYGKENISIFPLSSQNGKSNSSDEMTMLIREIIREYEIDLYQDTIHKDISQLDSEEEIETTVFFDDISGTGKTIIDFLKTHKEKLTNKNVVINLLAITEKSKCDIENYLQTENSLKVQIIAANTYGKISNNHPELSENELLLLTNYEEVLWGKNHKNILGYMDSQLIIGFSHNIPNNTLSSFWYHNDFGKIKKWNTLFKRFTLPKSKKQKQKQNFRVMRGRGNNNGL